MMLWIIVDNQQLSIPALSIMSVDNDDDCDEDNNEAWTQFE